MLCSVTSFGHEQLAKGSGQKTSFCHFRSSLGYLDLYPVLVPMFQEGSYWSSYWACSWLSYRDQDAVLQALLMSLNSKANLLSCHDKASKLEVQTCKSAHLRCKDKIYWMPILGVILQSQPNHQTELCQLGAAPASTNIKASTVNSNFRCSATLLSIFFPGYSSLTSIARPLPSS